MTSMAESAMKVRGFKKARDVLSVEGYDTSLQRYYVELLLEKHFSTCGKLSEIIVSRDSETGLLKSSACISFYGGEKAYEKALRLSGTSLRGWKLVVTRGNYSDYIDDDTDNKYDVVDTDGEEYDEDGVRIVEEYSTDDESVFGDNEVEELKNEERRMSVTGFDKNASNLDVMIKMCEHFSSCGEVTYVLASNDCPTDYEGWADVNIVGQGATDKAQKLGVCEEGGWKIKVDMVFPSRAEWRERLHQQYMAERKKKKKMLTSVKTEKLKTEKQ